MGFSPEIQSGRKVPHNTMADSLMDEISSFVEENTEAEIIDENREIR